MDVARECGTKRIGVEGGSTEGTLPADPRDPAHRRRFGYRRDDRGEGAFVTLRKVRVMRAVGIAGVLALGALGVCLAIIIPTVQGPLRRFCSELPVGLHADDIHSRAEQSGFAASWSMDRDELWVVSPWRFPLQYACVVRLQDGHGVGWEIRWND